MATRHLQIGPIRFVLQSDGHTSCRYDDWAYRPFFRCEPHADAPPAQVEMRLTVVAGGRGLPDERPFFEAGRNWAVWSTDAGLAFYSGYDHRARPRVCCDVQSDLRHGTLYIDDDVTDRPLRYPLDQVLSYGLLGTCGGVLLHGAAVVRDGAARVFAGCSGVGKSTLSGLCEAEGWAILNDDRVMLYPDPAGSGWRVAGTPWHGSGRFARNETLPLQGVFLLAQAKENRIEMMPQAETRLALLPVASIGWFLDEWAQAGLDAVDRLARQVPVRRFSFTPTRAAVHALLMEEVA